jgi:CRP-like cAMP-binding protein
MLLIMRATNRLVAYSWLARFSAHGRHMQEQIPVGAKVGSHTVLYRRGEPSSTYTLVLQGRAYVWAGSESFLSEISPWQCIGNNALSHADYCPDFTAVTAGPCRLLQICRCAGITCPFVYLVVFLLQLFMLSGTSPALCNT